MLKNDRLEPNQHAEFKRYGAKQIKNFRPGGTVGMSTGKILVVDDDRSFLETMRMRLQSADYEVSTASNQDEAIAASKSETFDLCTLDLGLVDCNGLSLLAELRSIDAELPVLILSGRSSVDTVVAAMKGGAYTYLTKPFDAAQLLTEIQKALENRRPSQMQVHDRPEFRNIVAQSDKMLAVLDLVSRIAKTDSTVYLHGESGTGKEVIAQAIHFASERRDSPFVAINCAALPEQLLESELFGHEIGAFTGADRSTPGLLMQAHRGTVLLDEIGDMPLSIQAKLLRALEERKFYSLGGETQVAVDVRVIVATNKDLREQVKKGLFRNDLFHRLHVVPIRLPALRERKEDIFPLANHFLRKLSQRMKKNVKGFTPEALQKLMDYDWPGNIRELENTIECAVAMSRHDVLVAEVILQPGAVHQSETGKAANSQTAEGVVGSYSYKDAKRRFEREYLTQLLRLSGGKVSQAARLAKKSRTDIYELLKKHEMRADVFKEL
jgi:two-component system response regulator GlrR